MRIRAVNSIGWEDRWIDQFVTNVDCKPNVAYNLNYKYNLNPKLLFFWFHSIFEYFCRKKGQWYKITSMFSCWMFKWIFCKVHHKNFPFVQSQVVIAFKITYVNHACSELTDSPFLLVAISFFCTSSVLN